jgi:hypothetical protein
LGTAKMNTGVQSILPRDGSGAATYPLTQTSYCSDD